MILEFSTCSGEAKLKIANDNKFKQLIQKVDKETINGRSIYKIKEPKDEMFLMVEGVNGTAITEENCRSFGKYTQDCEINSKETIYMIKYLTINSEIYGNRKSIEKGGKLKNLYFNIRNAYLGYSKRWS